MLEPWMIIAGISLGFSIPVLVSSYYTVILFLSSLRYPSTLVSWNPSPNDSPLVSILLASFNEKFVIGRTLDAVRNLDFPKEKLQVIVADDSTDDTRDVIDQKVEELRSDGITALVSRRDTRDGFKSGALNHAAPLLRGDYVLLLDADSTLPPETLTRALSGFHLDPRIGFVSFRVGHYNREQNLITRLFALQLDQGDTITKMGAYYIDAPYSFQGGFALLASNVLRQVGYWTNDSIVDDADLSCKIYSAGWRGVYLSDVKVFAEDPSNLEVWKKQAARVAQGWAMCIRSNWRKILGSDKLSLWRRLALVLFLLGPFSSLSWIVVTFVSAFGLLLGLTAPTNSIFTSPIYIIMVTLPLVFFFISGGYALYVQKIMTPRNLVLIPLISYTSSCMMTAISIGFLQGIRGKPGFFFRTPKAGLGSNEKNRQYFRDLRHDNVAIVEAVLATLAVGVSLIVLLDGVWLLSLSLMGFGALTLKSMNLSRILDSRSSSKPLDPTKSGILDSQSDPS
jgi:cellulose synthase/poly-beta-1,6-N-acetylglucosamine synthase-like glycosyltransferase